MKTRKPWTILLAIFLVLLLAGFTTVAVIVKQEGVDGLFKRKRAALEQVMPEAVPIHDKFEKEVRNRLPDEPASNSKATKN